ncbi:MAG TPA: DMT family transporter [Arenicellales bacterium]|nr:DMT family transporter [Arenicellales bacterium]
MENLRGSLLMVAAMFGFTLEDALIKQMAGSQPVGQVIVLIGCGGALNFGLLSIARGHRLMSPALLTRPVLLRNLAEAVAAVTFVSAIVLTTLSSASAILQTTPLALTLGAALFLGETVGWRRWTAIGVGFIGVLLIIQPGLAGFAPASLLAIIAVAAVALRDLVSRAIPAHVTGSQLAAWAFASLIPAGALMMLSMGDRPVLPAMFDLVLLAGAFVVGGFGYYALVVATRTGEVAVVVPFRYTRLVFAMVLGAIVFGERPDPLTLSGAALIVSAGVYTIWREARLRRRSAAD